MDFNSPDRFKEEDKKKVVDFLNFVANKAKFEVNVKETIEFYSLLSYCQQTLLKKINAHVLDDIKVHEPESEEVPEEVKKKTRTRKKSS